VATRKKRSKKQTKVSSDNIFKSMRKVVFALIAVLLIAGLFYGGKEMFLRNSYFKVKEIIFNRDFTYFSEKGESKIKDLYIGRNMFTINLKQMQMVVESEFPQHKKIEIRRNMPDTFEIDIVSRQPVGVIDTGKGFVVDREGIVLMIGEGSEDLIKIKGITFFLNAPSRGQSVRNASIKDAIRMIEVLNRRPSISGKNIDYVNVSNRNNVLLSINGVIVKMGKDDFTEKIEKLSQILRDPDVSMDDIKYIDLRFEDAVISPK